MASQIHDFVETFEVLAGNHVPCKALNDHLPAAVRQLPEPCGVVEEFSQDARPSLFVTFPDDDPRISKDIGNLAAVRRNDRHPHDRASISMR